MIKSTFYLIALLFLSVQISFGAGSKESKILISVYVPQQESQIPSAAQSMLENKLNQIITNNGLAGGNNSRFIMLPKINVLSKDVLATAPVTYAYTFEIVFFIGDGIEDIKFSNYSITLKAVGENDTKAYISAIKNINVSDPKYVAFINEAKGKIIEYYNNKCNKKIEDARNLKSRNLFDEGIYSLVDVPQVCDNCYLKCNDMILEIYKAKMDHNCQEVIQNSTVLLSQNKYEEASSALIGITPDLQCYSDAKGLLRSIGNKRCQENLQNAKTLISQDKYDEAANYLSNITPDLQCYNDASKVLKSITDHKCSVALAQAKASWANKDLTTTTNNLSQIPADATCYPEAQLLVSQITIYIKEKENREWNFKLQQHKDATELAKQNIELEKQRSKESSELAKQQQADATALAKQQQAEASSFAKQQQKDNTELQKLSVQAAREVGVAYAKNQPQIVYNTNVNKW